MGSKSEKEGVALTFQIEEPNPQFVENTDHIPRKEKNCLGG